MPPFDSEAEKQAKQFVEELAQKLINAQNGQPFTFLLVGKTGVGKSSTINILMGKEIAPVGEYEPTTMDIKNYHCEFNGVKVVVTDTPGLCDDLEEAGNDYKYLEMIRSQVKQVDSMWFVTRLDDTRVSTDEKKAIKLIAECFKAKIWEQAIIVFTFADNLSPEKYPIALEKRTDLIRKEIAKYAGLVIADNVPAVGVSNNNSFTPDGNKWLGELFTQVYCRLSEEGRAAFLMSTIDRIKPPEKEKEIVDPSTKPRYDQDIVDPNKSSKTRKKINVFIDNYVSSYPPPTKPSYDQDIELTHRQADLIQNKTLKTAGKTLVYAGIGAAIGAVAGPVGAAVGGAVGVAVGFLGSIFGR